MKWQCGMTSGKGFRDKTPRRRKKKKKVAWRKVVKHTLVNAGRLSYYHLECIVIVRLLTCDIISMLPLGLFVWIFHKRLTFAKRYHAGIRDRPHVLLWKSTGSITHFSWWLPVSNDACVDSIMKRLCGFLRNKLITCSQEFFIPLKAVFNSVLYVARLCHRMVWC